MRATEEQDLLSLEKQFWDALKSRDATTAASLSDDLCVVVGPQGIGEVNPDKLRDMIKNATYEVTKFSFDERDVHIRKLSEDVVIVAYKVREDLIVDGKPESLEAFDTSVWVRRGDRWLCAMHTESLKGDPFGRHDLEIGLDVPDVP